MTLESITNPIDEDSHFLGVKTLTDSSVTIQYGQTTLSTTRTSFASNPTVALSDGKTGVIDAYTFTLSVDAPHNDNCVAKITFPN